MPISEEMRQAFYSKAEVQKTGAIRYLDEALEAAIAASPSDAERHERSEPIGYKRPVDKDGTAFWCSHTQNCYYSQPVYAAPSPPAAVQEPVAVKGETPSPQTSLSGWQPMETAPKDGKHSILAIPAGGGFIYSIQGSFMRGKWMNAADINAEPLAWMPNILLPDEFCPWTDEFKSRAALSATATEVALSTSQSEPAPTTSSGVTYTQAECDEMCEIAERDGYEKAVQEIDQKTGGDGEYRYCLGMEDSDWHTPDAPAMIQRIVDRFEVLNLFDEATKTGSDQPDDFPAPEIAAIREVLPPELLKLTFAIQHNPNCPSPWLVRLPGKSGAIDMKPYGDPLGLVRHQTGDILGFGKTLEEAARAALTPEQGEAK